MGKNVTSLILSPLLSSNTSLVNHSALQVQSLILRHECLMYVLT
ncbi:hypothetical protein [Candidatus Tisiphia endosymbiont of Parasteatoda lunata]